jgi:hypothetical protein
MGDRRMRDGGARRAVATVALMAATFLLAPIVPIDVAGAQSVTSEELRALAERAASDPASLARLRGVDQVDGRPVDLRRALDGADGEDLRSRLRTLATGAGGGPGPAAGATSPSDEARAILDGRKFKPAPALRPFRGVLRQLGDWLRPIGGPLARFWDRVAGNTPGRVLLVIAVIGVAALASMALIRRRSTGGVSRVRVARERRRTEDPDELEREADAAERAGELEHAFRLRFRAGLLRLDRAGVIAYRPALTTGELTRRVPSPRLHGLASAFEEIAYGGRPAGADDLQSARADWPRVLQEVGER